jgi:hypothetical protein
MWTGGIRMAERGRWQLWLHGNDLVGHCEDCTKSEAMELLREEARNYGYKRLPAYSTVSLIRAGYYEEIAESNRRQGFGLKAGD